MVALPCRTAAVSAVLRVAATGAHATEVLVSGSTLGITSRLRHPAKRRFTFRAFDAALMKKNLAMRPRVDACCCTRHRPRAASHRAGSPHAAREAALEIAARPEMVAP